MTRLLLVALAAETAFLVLQLVVWRLLLAGWPAPADRDLRVRVLRPDRVPRRCTCWWGSAALAALVVRSARRRLSAVSLRLWTLYLHMVGVLWAIMFVAVYLL